MLVEGGLTARYRCTEQQKVTFPAAQEVMRACYSGGPAAAAPKSSW
jgi:hypothetical protein